MELLAVEKLIWLFAVIPAVLVYVYCFARKRAMLKKFAQVHLLGVINSDSSVFRQIFKAGLVVSAGVLLLISLAEPAGNARARKVKRMGRDIAVVLDVSRSMLAEDISPNRLERAKIAVGDLLETLEGDRIGLVVFAGSASIKCPLTHNYSFMRMALSEVDTESTPRGGTNIGDAIRKVTDEVFAGEGGDKHRDIILISDGDDHESFAAQAARRAAEKGIRIIAIGLGDPQVGARIPVRDGGGGMTFLKDKEGKEVWTRLGGEKGDTLRDIVYATDEGKYLPVKTGTFNLDEVYRQIVARSRQRELASSQVMQYDQYYPWFIAAALLLLVTEQLTSEKKRVKESDRELEKVRES